MITELKTATMTDGEAAASSASTATVPGYVLQTPAMTATLDERAEQITNLLNVLGTDNNEAVAEDIKDVILTVHVPAEVEDAVEQAFDKLEKPVLMRLSAVGSIADPLAPAMILGLEDMKSVLDALRMLYAEMHSAANLATGDKHRQAAIIIQPMLALANTYRVLRSGDHTVIEATQGYGAWVGYGEPERYLFTGDELTKGTPGDDRGLLFDGDGIYEERRETLTEEDIRECFAYAKAIQSTPLLVGRRQDGSFVCYGGLGN